MGWKLKIWVIESFNVIFGYFEMKIDSAGPFEGHKANYSQQFLFMKLFPKKSKLNFHTNVQRGTNYHHDISKIKNNADIKPNN